MTARVTLREAAEFLLAHDNYLLLSHRRPDGDTIGSCAALCRALRALGKQAWVYPNPQFTPKFAPYLEGLVFEATGNRQQATEKAFPLGGRWHGEAVTDEGASDDLPGPRLILEAPHPSPLSACRGFFGSRPFSQINAFLSAHGETPIRWTE